MSQHHPECGMFVRPDRNNETAAAPVLQRVSASGRLDGLLFELDVRQTYRNEGEETLEVVYIFPLAFDAVLLGLHVELGGVRRSGVVAERRVAEFLYEDAMTEGDTPILLVRADDGLYTVSLGNLKPGEEAVVEYRYGQLLSFAQGQVRLCIPTTIAPRYGIARLPVLLVPSATLEADYPLALEVDVRGVLGRATIGCASHTCTIQPVEDGVHLRLGSGASLDRDVVVTLADPVLNSTAQWVEDGTERVVMMSMQPGDVTTQRESISLKLLVDCSYSMAGDGIASARVALQHVASLLRETDRVSYSRFGSEVRHDFRRMTPARTDTVKVLAESIAATVADLGGTDVEAALRSTFELGRRQGPADVLLVTDGETWAVDELIATARASGHRVFAVGVGSSPAEPVLRRLAEATGGACEFATPGENLRAAIDRMFARIRQGAHRSLRLQWDDGSAEPLWTSPLPHSLFCGDTLHVFAGFSSPVPYRVRLLGAADAPNVRELASAVVERGAGGSDAPARLAASARLPACTPQEALALALKHQLITEQTHCLVVHERAEADKGIAFPHLHAVPQMLAAGWGGMGHLPSAAVALCVSDPPIGAAVGRDGFVAAAAPFARFEPPTEALLHARARLSLLESALDALADPSSPPLEEVLDAADAIEEDALCIEPLMRLGHTRRVAWALWVHWRLREEQRVPGPEAREALAACLAHVDGDRVAAALAVLDQRVRQAAPDEPAEEKSVWRRLFRRSAA